MERGGSSKTWRSIQMEDGKFDGKLSLLTQNVIECLIITCMYRYVRTTIYARDIYVHHNTLYVSNVYYARTTHTIFFSIHNTPNPLKSTNLLHLFCFIKGNLTDGHKQLMGIFISHFITKLSSLLHVNKSVQKINQQKDH